MGVKSENLKTEVVLDFKLSLQTSVKRSFPCQHVCMYACMCSRYINFLVEFTKRTSPGNVTVEDKWVQVSILFHRTQKILTRNFRATMFGMLPKDLLLPAGRVIVQCSSAVNSFPLETK